MVRQYDPDRRPPQAKQYAAARPEFKAKSAFGLVNVPLLILDEPGSLEVVGGTLLADALFSAQGKPNSSAGDFIGTLSPASPGGWWHDLGRRRDERLDLRPSGLWVT